MVKRFLILSLLAVLAATVFCPLAAYAQDAKPAAEPISISLPTPTLDCKTTVEQAIQKRRSVRTYSNEPVTLQQVSQLLWAAQGITDPATGHRTAPSAQATYPLKVYFVAGNVKELDAGVYRYIPQGHKLELVMKGDQRANIGTQPQMRNAPALLVYAVDYTVVGPKYGDRAKPFAAIEVGHSAHNVLLEEVALGLVGVGMAGFDETKAKTALKLPEKEEILYVVSAGKRQG